MAMLISNRSNRYYYCCCCCCCSSRSSSSISSSSSSSINSNIKVKLCWFTITLYTRLTKWTERFSRVITRVKNLNAYLQTKLSRVLNTGAGNSWLPHYQLCFISSNINSNSNIVNSIDRGVPMDIVSDMNLNNLQVKFGVEGDFTITYPLRPRWDIRPQQCFATRSYL